MENYNNRRRHTLRHINITTDPRALCINYLTQSPTDTVSDRRTITMIDPILREKFKEFMSDDPNNYNKANVLYFINILDNEWTELQYRIVMDDIKDDPLFKKELNRLKMKHGEMISEPEPVFKKEGPRITVEKTKWVRVKETIRSWFKIQENNNNE